MHDLRNCDWENTLNQTATASGTESGTFYDKLLHWRHSGCDGVSDHHPHDCLLNRLFGRRLIRKHQSSASLALVRGIHRWPVNSPHKWPVTRKMFPFDDVIMWVKTIANDAMGPWMCRIKVVSFHGKWLQLRALSPWWHHQMETFSALLSICAENSPITGEFPSSRTVTRGFDVFFHLCLNKRLNKLS